jgi:hypothetical protein
LFSSSELENEINEPEVLSGFTIRAKRKSFTISFTGAVKHAPQVGQALPIAFFAL